MSCLTVFDLFEQVGSANFYIWESTGVLENSYSLLITNTCLNIYDLDVSSVEIPKRFPIGMKNLAKLHTY